MTNRGIIHSMDALLSLLIVLVVVFTVNYYVNSSALNDSQQSDWLKQMSVDVGTVLEKNGRASTAIQNNNVSVIRTYLNQLPHAWCVDVSIFSNNDLNSAILAVVRPSCKTDASEYAVTNRSIVVTSGSSVSFYVMKVKAWWRT